ncbi:hypothetical protein WL76_03445 [Burkholderia ubonensis]|uniref:hypothetical protein n=1 Tax=Burkholderia ubonensis TaxID=101571 RepID=UPI00075CE2F2|nr:hypothetical protein [Burkholderia ubonensis]KWE61150.1 hypothetical protein WL76_03445 [Burkholderia ubonensis]
MDDTQHPTNFPPLTIEQIRALAVAVREGFGPGLSRAAFIDCMLLLLEDMLGFEAGDMDARCIESAWAT